MRLVIGAILLLCAFSTSAQSEQPSREQYEQFKRNARKQYEDFRDKANQEYADFIERAWEQYSMNAPIPLPVFEEVRPSVHVNDTVLTEAVCYPSDCVSIVKVPAPKPQPLPVSFIKPFEGDDRDSVHFVFYGTPLSIRFSEKQKFTLSDLEPKTIADAWRFMSVPRFNNTIRDCLSLRDSHTLNDWSYLQMLQEFSKAALGDTDEARLLMAYIYTQSGYRTRIVKTLDTPEPTISMLFGTDYIIYGKSYVVSAGVNYFPIRDEFGKLAFVNFPFPNEQSMFLPLTNEPRLSKELAETRHLQSRYYSDVEGEVNVDLNLIRFFEDYPSYCEGDDYMTKWAFYANTPMDAKVKAQLYPQLLKSIDLENKNNGVEQLLDFVQTAFKYGYDNEIWGYDRAFFAEETLYYPFCDCEDRAILFSRLVRDLLDMEVLLVHYPGHLATAVAMGDGQLGDYVLLDGKRYTICDPTNIGQCAGVTMRGMDKSRIKVIKLD